MKYEEGIKKMALELVFQITGRRVPEDVQCEVQGDSDYQIAMYYLRKAHNATFNTKER